VNRIVRIFRRLWSRKGFGIHSPFVYDLVTNVIGEKCPYYYFREMEALRRRMEKEHLTTSYLGRPVSMDVVFRLHALPAATGELLFRLANHYHPEYCLTVGPSSGFAPLYLTGCDSRVRCMDVSSEYALTYIAKRAAQQMHNSRIRFLTGHYGLRLFTALPDLPRLDGLYFSRHLTDEMLLKTFALSLPFVHNNSFCLIDGIHRTKERFASWQILCSNSFVTATIDLYSCGLVFFRAGLPQRTYMSIL
jgi:hypothetical protein